PTNPDPISTPGRYAVPHLTHSGKTLWIHEQQVATESFLALRQ
ncbi:MAG: hypothetical protein QOI81_597, partial [Actinomycetota bacterium]|nr:hypothetical protein [Actinomycetota bacterium]